MTDKMREEFEKWLDKGNHCGCNENMWKAWQAARTVPDEKMVAFIKEVSEQKPEKPDYWSSCSQCSSNQSEAEDIILSLAAAPEGKK